MDEGDLGVLGGKELSVVARGGFEDATVRPSIGEINSYIPWEGKMSCKEGQGGIVPIEKIVGWDFAGKGPWWLKIKNIEKKIKKLPRPGIEPESLRPQLSVLTVRPPKQRLPL